MTIRNQRFTRMLTLASMLFALPILAADRAPRPLSTSSPSIQDLQPAAAPMAPALPEAMHRPLARWAILGAGVDRSGFVALHPSVTVALQAAAAAAAADDIERRGLARYYQEGFRRGQRLALDDLAVGLNAHSHGLQRGRQDLRAQHQGRALGRRAAEARQALNTEAMATAQAPVPRLQDQVRDQPLAQVPRYGALIQPWALYRQGQVASNATDWARPAAAFARWAADHPRRSSAEAAFTAAYGRAVAQQAEPLEVAWAQGFRDGWAHGADVRRSWSFEQGYHLGARAAVLDAAAASYAEIALRHAAQPLTPPAVTSRVGTLR